MIQWWKIKDFYENNILKTGIKRQILNARYGTLNKILHIVPEHKVLYVPIPKSANTSIIKILWEAQGIEVDNSNQNIHKTLAQKPVAPVLSNFSNDQVLQMLEGDGWFRFTFVRNPYTRLISSYKDKILNTKRNRNFLKRLDWKESRLPTFDEFIANVVKQDVHQMDWHWRPQYDLAIPQLIHFDFVGKIENFNEDIKVVFEKLNVTDTDIIEKALVPENKTKKMDISISQETIERIQEKYKKDFEFFGYDTAFDQ